MDLNADVGEGCGDDLALYPLVEQVNIAAGGHAGGGMQMAETIAQAHAAGASVGVHPSYPDHENFGRVSQYDDWATRRLQVAIGLQIEEFLATARRLHVPVHHMKPHGALYHDMEAHQKVRDGILDLAESHRLTVIGPAGGATQKRASERGVDFRAECFADRRYQPDGQLVPRSKDGSVLGVEAAMEQAESLLEGYVTACDATKIPVRATTMCVHGDTPAAVEMVQRLRGLLGDRTSVAL